MVIFMAKKQLEKHEKEPVKKPSAKNVRKSKTVKPENATAETKKPEKKKKIRKPSKKQQEKGINTKAKKKTASARAVIKNGKGIVKINKMNLNIFQPNYLKMFIQEPLTMAGGVTEEIDINVSVKGSGFMSQAVAARSAIAKALINYTGDDELRNKFLAYDRLLLVDDARRKEAKKPLGRGARKKKQSSKR